ncbi:hypothetical protein AB1E19_012962 [Capra hircus]
MVEKERGSNQPGLPDPAAAAAAAGASVDAESRRSQAGPDPEAWRARRGAPVGPGRRGEKRVLSFLRESEATVSAERQLSTIIFWEATKEGSSQTRKARPAPASVRSRDPGRAERKRGAQKVALPRARSARVSYAAETPSSSHGRARRPEGDEASTAEAAGVGARDGWVSG